MPRNADQRNRRFDRTRRAELPESRLTVYSHVKHAALQVDRAYRRGEDPGADNDLVKLVAAIAELKVDIAEGYDVEASPCQPLGLPITPKEIELANLRNMIKLVWQHYTNGGLRRGDKLSLDNPVQT